MEKERHPSEEETKWEAPEVVEISVNLPRKADGNIDYSEMLKQRQENFNEHIKNVTIKALLMYMKSGGIDFMKVREISKTWKSKLEKVNETNKGTHIMNIRSALIPKSKSAEMALQELLRRIESGEI